MMIHAYDKNYLEKAQVTLGTMLDYAVNDAKFNLTEFYKLFLSSNISIQFENGNCSVLVGKSGVELVYDIFFNLNKLDSLPSPIYKSYKTKEYWTGWALAYYQWYTSLPFSYINEKIPIQDIRKLYNPYHEMDIMQFVDKMNDLYKENTTESNLKRIRKEMGLTQKELSAKTNIPLKTIQHYEQRLRNINKAEAQYLIAISKILCCRVEDLLELE